MIEGVVGGAHQGAGFDVLEAYLLLADALVFGEFVRMDEANNGEVVARGLEILTQGKDVGALRGEILHGGKDFVLFLA